MVWCFVFTLVRRRGRPALLVVREIIDKLQRGWEQTPAAYERQRKVMKRARAANGDSRGLARSAVGRDVVQ